MEKVRTIAAGENGQAISALPLHSQVREALRRQILDGSWPAHAQIPSESQLIREFGVSRITVRQALGDLQKEGLIFKVMGKGTYVSKPKVFQNLSRLQGFNEAMGASGYETFAKVISVRTCPATPQVAARLGLQAGETVQEIQRLRYLNREPLSLDTSYFPLFIGEHLAAADLAVRDIFSILENDLGHDLTHADLQIEAVTAHEELARLLQVEEGSAVLRMERLTCAGDQPLDFEYLYLRGDAFQYRLRINRT